MSSYKVRKAVLADVPAMVEMQLAMAFESENLRLDRATVTRGMTIPFERQNVADYYVVEEMEEGKIVSMLMTTQEWSDWRAGSVVWIQSAFTVAEHRRRGLFRMLYAHIREMVESSEFYQGIRLYVETENKSAMATYRNLGMEVEHYHMMKWMKTDF